MTCPTCQTPTRVVDTRRFLHGVARRRRCPKCRQAFYTAETSVEQWLHKDTRRGRYKSRPKYKFRLPPPPPENWIDRIRKIFQPNP
jgi:transcriptional regulator NrdR family protein